MFLDQPMERLTTTAVRDDQASTYQRLLLALHNTGTQLLHPHGSLQVSDTRGHLLRTFPLTLDTFIPQTSIDYPVYIQQHPLAPETYQATLRLIGM